jgi:phosphopantothenoylcysteine decarboxylase/phosphopantothenate--cysteine ligase
MKRMRAAQNTTSTLPGLKGKHIILGVSGSIAIYKALDLCSLFRKQGAEVKVVMTQAATKLVAPITFEAISRHPVYTDLFSREHGWEMEHISFARWGDLLLVAPATANTIGKFAHGIADDALSSLFLSYQGPTFIAPAMNSAMYTHPIVQQNLQCLIERGVRQIAPQTGFLASGEQGIGRLEEPERILQIISSFFSQRSALAGRRILVTAGPTQEFFDPVRYLSNPSSGKMGYAVAEEAARRGAQVTLISGPTSLPDPPGITLHRVVSARQMHQAVMRNVSKADAIVLAAAVSDYRPEGQEAHKRKKSSAPLQTTLIANPDIAAAVREKKSTRQIVIGFAAETRDLVQQAKQKLATKGFDMIVANRVGQPGSGFQSDYNEVTLIDTRGTIQALPRMTKIEVASRVLDKLALLLRPAYNKKR